MRARDFKLRQMVSIHCRKRASEGEKEQDFVNASFTSAPEGKRVPVFSVRVRVQWFQRVC